MASVLDQLPASTLSLVGNGFNAISTPGNTTTPSWGYVNPANGGTIPNPYNSELQNTYSVDGSPNERIVDFNRTALGGVTAVKPPASLDELDRNAPNNTQAGLGGVVSQVYKSPQGRQYKQLGPQPGRY
jgi:hypothetical protein